MSDVLVKPAFQSAIADSGSATRFGPNAWNAARLFSGGSLGDLLYRDTASATGASWINPDWIDVRTYGALGDGIADDAPAFQAALDVLPTDGGVIVIPAGQYFIGTKLIHSKDGLTFLGAGPGATQLFTQGNDLLELNPSSGNTLSRIWIEGFEAYDADATATTTIGINVLAYSNLQSAYRRLRLHGFGGGELKLRGINNGVIEQNYFSHYTVGSTGHALKVYMHPSEGSPTAFTVQDNYFASTVVTAPMVLLQDFHTVLLSRNIFELVPASGIGLQLEATAGNTASDAVLCGQHFEAITGTAWKVIDVSNVTAISANYSPVKEWSALGASYRYVTEISPGGEPYMQGMRHIAIGTSPATTGDLRLNNNGYVVSHNAAGTDNLYLIYASAADEVTIGGNTGAQIVLAPGTADIRWNKPLVSLGGGGAPTLGTVGGSGPTVTTQNSWMRVVDSAGAAFWVPVWK